MISCHNSSFVVTLQMYKKLICMQVLFLFYGKKDAFFLFKRLN